MQSRETGVRVGIVGIERKSLAEIPQSSARPTVTAEKHRIVATQVSLVCGDVGRRAALDAKECPLAQPQVELTRYRAGNIALNREDGFQLPIVGFRPASGAIPRIHKSDLNAELWSDSL